MKYITKRVTTYCGLALIFVIGLYAASRPYVGESVRILAANSAICSLLGALFLILRDDIAFTRQLQREESERAYKSFREDLAHDRNQKSKDVENVFTMAANSHMAAVSFDRHVEFCEEYVKAMIVVTDELLKRGPHPDSVNLPAKLFVVRQKYVLWLSPDTERAMNLFEGAIRKIGADAYLLKSMQDEKFEERSTVVKRMHALFLEILEIDQPADAAPSDCSVKAVLDQMKMLLGNERLAELRWQFLDRADQNVLKSVAESARLPAAAPE
jgi:hypothetical protein